MGFHEAWSPYFFYGKRKLCTCSQKLISNRIINAYKCNFSSNIFFNKNGRVWKEKNRGFDENINPKYEKENLPQVICFGLR
jgi:hypothetical protein